MSTAADFRGAGFCRQLREGSTGLRYSLSQHDGHQGAEGAQPVTLDPASTKLSITQPWGNWDFDQLLNALEQSPIKNTVDSLVEMSSHVTIS